MYKSILIFLFGISLPLGDQLNPILGINVSLLFLFTCILSLPYVILPNDKIKVPFALKLFYGYALFHVFILYFLIRPELLSEHLKITVFGNVISNESYLTIIFRYILYLFSPILIARTISDEGNFYRFSRIFIITFVSSILVTYFTQIITSSSFRFSGGFHDPNTFGGMSIIACAICWFYAKRNNLFKIGFLFFILCIIFSGSRACSLGLALGVIFILFKSPISFSNKFLILITVIACSYILVTTDNPLTSRLSNMRGSEVADLRFIIWSEYLSNIDTYFWTGTGFGLKYEAFKLDQSMRTTHNQYLLQLVQFGIIGFLLYSYSYIDIIRKSFSLNRKDKSFFPFEVLFLSFSIVMFFSDYDNTRELATLISIFLCFYNYQFNEHRNSTQRSTIWRN